jgi:hypothetical protein
VDRSEPRITGGDAVAPLGFEGGKEPSYTVDGEIRYVQTIHRSA